MYIISKHEFDMKIIKINLFNELSDEMFLLLTEK